MEYARRAWGRLALLALVTAVFPGGAGPATAEDPVQVLVFSKTTAFRHPSIADGIQMIEELGLAHGFGVEPTEDASTFTDVALATYDVVVFLNTTGNVLDSSQQDAFRAWIEAGGGFVGIHSAADTEHGWDWYGDLLGGGARFISHPPIQTATVVKEDPSHPSTHHLPAQLSFTDEWYNFQANPRSAVTVLLTLDESSYDPGANAMGADHPIAWAHRVGEGRSWYTNLGHRDQTYADPGFREHVLGGLLWAAGRLIFRDGFEAGGAEAWFSTEPSQGLSPIRLPRP